ncbi:PREDICTED: uncharacterized protein LOC102018787 [Chinchilla lanigera]|uniref:uncharacterized protein LOC102018787 n=1 Tax=Chinchilla lanigera TaxID=34839 RepID=UPI00038EF67D|nr:PREDICTED: uncharacterized protein LOC102018787 [Chinchilla lanigera]
MLWRRAEGRPAGQGTTWEERDGKTESGGWVENGLPAFSSKLPKPRGPSPPASGKPLCAPFSLVLLLGMPEQGIRWRRQRWGRRREVDKGAVASLRIPEALGGARCLWQVLLFPDPTPGGQTPLTPPLTCRTLCPSGGAGPQVAPVRAATPGSTCELSWKAVHTPLRGSRWAVAAGDVRKDTVTAGGNEDPTPAAAARASDR